MTQPVFNIWFIGFVVLVASFVGGFFGGVMGANTLVELGRDPIEDEEPFYVI